jgi:hypothetical protein
MEGSLSQWTLTADLTIHWKRAPLADRGRGTILAGFDELNDGLWSQALVIVIVDLRDREVRRERERGDMEEQTHLNHWSIGTGSHALNLTETEHAIRGCLSLLWSSSEGGGGSCGRQEGDLNLKMVLDRLFDLFRATDHTRSGSTELEIGKKGKAR